MKCVCRFSLGVCQDVKAQSLPLFFSIRIISSNLVSGFRFYFSFSIYAAWYYGILFELALFFSIKKKVLTAAMAGDFQTYVDMMFGWIQGRN